MRFRIVSLVYFCYNLSWKWTGGEFIRSEGIEIMEGIRNEIIYY
jgi:hypothetical protein